ncbi:MAG: dynamin family protein [Arenicellales bacterium]
MTITALQKKLDSYSNWRHDLLTELEAYKSWLDDEDLLEGEDELRVLELIESLKSDKIVLALVAEFSRGKTELINSIFFADYKKRLLPSSVGRTTMCPTEIRYDEKEPPFIQLLPIETRKSSLTIDEYKEAAVNWSRTELDIDSPEQMTEALLQLIETKEISEQEAKELGFPPHTLDIKENNKLQVPVWRHAVINYPHPLLKSGLVILDTPGLNALGTEPELTLNMLPMAHTIMFILAADTGVTRSDMDIWRNHITLSLNPREQNVMAVLNKIDTMWDDLHDDSFTQANIRRQIEETSRILDIDEDLVVPVSAQKGLIAKIKNDRLMLNRSGLPKLEDKLSVDLIDKKQSLIQKKVQRELGVMVKSTRDVYLSRLNTLVKERHEILNLRGQSKSILVTLSEQLQSQSKQLSQAMDDYHKTVRIMNDQAKRLRQHLSSKNIDFMIGASRISMQETWNTFGLKRGMADFFDQAENRLSEVNSGAVKLSELVDRIYEEFKTRHNLEMNVPPEFDIEPFIEDFMHLRMDGEQFRDSMMLVVTEQHYVIKRFFITMASRARRILDETNYALRAWSKAILQPISTQIEEHKEQIGRRLSNIEKLKTNHNNLEQRVTAIEEDLTELRDKTMTLQRILARIQNTE